MAEKLDVKKYAEQLMQEAGATDEQKQAFIALTANEKFSKRLSNDVLMQSDYNRNMDELRKKEKSTADYYESLTRWKAEQEAILAASNGGRSEPNGNQPDFSVFKKEWEEKLNQQGNQMIGLLETGMAIASRHAVEFKEPLDTAALKKIAVDKNLSLAQAYDELVAPRRSELSAAERKAELVKAKEEGAREFASTHKIPIDTSPRDYHVMFDRDPKKQVGADDYQPNSGQLSPSATRTLRDNFVEEYNKAGAHTSGT